VVDSRGWFRSGVERIEREAAERGRSGVGLGDLLVEGRPVDGQRPFQSTTAYSVHVAQLGAGDAG
jgi:hypothetical protein